MRKTALAILASLLLLQLLLAGTVYEGRGVWVHPPDLGKTQKDVDRFFNLLKRSNINIVFLLVKSGSGRIYWHSKKFAEAIHPDYRDFDVLKAAVKAAKKYGIKLHAWLCDFIEGPDWVAFKKHPEWAMVNPDGGYTFQEKLEEGRKYNYVWMCPNRRPGYTDQWLLPMIEEIVRNYDVDGIHHDYVRYPGDVAPDSYCFCDYCLEQFLVYNHFFYLNRPQLRIPVRKLRPHPSANWELDFTRKPPNWDKMSRKEKAEFILEGKTIDRADMDYFFYTMRSDAITRFVREAWERAFRIRPEVEFSAAVFVNAMQSGRFLGQRWTDFAPWLDIVIPMNYRSHFQGSFEDYLLSLEDYIKAQKRWLEGKSHLYVGISAHYIYKEEWGPVREAIKLLRKAPASNREKIKALIVKTTVYLRRFSKPRARRLYRRYQAFARGKLRKEALIGELEALLKDPPAGFFPPEKLLRTIETVRKAGAEGIVIFAAGIVTRNKLWPAVQKAFAEPALLPHEHFPVQNKLSIQFIRKLLLKK